MSHSAGYGKRNSQDLSMQLRTQTVGNDRVSRISLLHGFIFPAYTFKVDSCHQILDIEKFAV